MAIRIVTVEPVARAVNRLAVNRPDAVNCKAKRGSYPATAVRRTYMATFMRKRRAEAKADAVLLAQMD
jgi:hypothetical protein